MSSQDDEWNCAEKAEGVFGCNDPLTSGLAELREAKLWVTRRCVAPSATKRSEAPRSAPKCHEAPRSVPKRTCTPFSAYLASFYSSLTREHHCKRPYVHENVEGEPLSSLRVNNNPYLKHKVSHHQALATVTPRGTLSVPRWYPPLAYNALMRAKKLRHRQSKHFQIIFHGSSTRSYCFGKMGVWQNQTLPVIIDVCYHAVNEWYQSW